jgi:hypothetical protein
LIRIERLEHAEDDVTAADRVRCGKPEWLGPWMPASNEAIEWLSDDGTLRPLRVEGEVVRDVFG